jgi:hypothetical protein
MLTLSSFGVRWTVFGVLLLSLLFPFAAALQEIVFKAPGQQTVYFDIAAGSDAISLTVAGAELPELDVPLGSFHSVPWRHAGTAELCVVMVPSIGDDRLLCGFADKEFNLSVGPEKIASATLYGTGYIQRRSSGGYYFVNRNTTSEFKTECLKWRRGKCKAWDDREYQYSKFAQAGSLGGFKQRPAQPFSIDVRPSALRQGSNIVSFAREAPEGSRQLHLSEVGLYLALANAFPSKVKIDVNADGSVEWTPGSEPSLTIQPMPLPQSGVLDSEHSKILPLPGCASGCRVAVAVSSESAGIVLIEASGTTMPVEGIPFEPPEDSQGLVSKWEYSPLFSPFESAAGAPSPSSSSSLPVALAAGVAGLAAFGAAALFRPPSAPVIVPAEPLVSTGAQKGLLARAGEWVVAHSDALKKTSDGLGWASLGLFLGGLALSFTGVGAVAGVPMMMAAFGLGAASGGIDIAVGSARKNAGVADFDDDVRLLFAPLAFIPGGGKISGQVGRNVVKKLAPEVAKPWINPRAIGYKFAALAKKLGIDDPSEVKGFVENMKELTRVKAEIKKLTAQFDFGKVLKVVPDFRETPRAYVNQIISKIARKHGFNKADKALLRGQLAELLSEKGPHLGFNYGLAEDVAGSMSNKIWLRVRKAASPTEVLHVGVHEAYHKLLLDAKSASRVIKHYFKGAEDSVVRFMTDFDRPPGKFKLGDLQEDLINLALAKKYKKYPWSANHWMSAGAKEAVGPGGAPTVFLLSMRDSVDRLRAVAKALKAPNFEKGIVRMHSLVNNHVNKQVANKLGLKLAKPDTGLVSMPRLKKLEGFRKMTGKGRPTAKPASDPGGGKGSSTWDSHRHKVLGQIKKSGSVVKSFGSKAASGLKKAAGALKKAKKKK